MSGNRIVNSNINSEELRVKSEKYKFREFEGITLISLVITIVILIILAGVAINLGIGENGIFRRAKQTKEQYNLTSAREKLELVLLYARTEKEVNDKYDSEEFLDNMLEEKDISVNGNSVTVDNYIFLIDREKLVITDSLGETQIKVTKEIESYNGKNENGKYEVEVLLTIESNTEIKTVTIENPDGTNLKIETDKLKIAKDMILELDEEYKIIVTTSNGKEEIRKIIEKSEETIRTAEELAEFRDKANTGLTYEGKTIKLGNDIDLSSICYKVDGTPENDKSWEPINQFKGTFNGNNHMIDNLYINSKSSYQGLFGKLSSGGIIKSLIIGENSKIMGIDLLGSVAGISEGIIRDCSNYGTIEGKGGSRSGNIGGIVGTNYNLIERCFNKGDIKMQGCVAGGITGRNYGGTLKDSYNIGKVESFGYDSSAHALTGGIAGGNSNNATIENAYNIGDITSQYSYVGGITGYNGNSSAGTQVVKNVFNAGTIRYGSQTPSSNVGEGLGYLIGRYGSLTGKYKNTTKDDIKSWDEETIKTNLGDGFTKDINNINDGYPILKKQITEDR